MFEKILIANRGEIACRVIRSARRLGVATVAVYSDADADALHVRLADEAVAIGPAAAAQSYLDVDRIVRACRDSGAQAVHPGYGFLSENAEFAEVLERAGVVFIGPPADAIRAMGDKITSKRIAAEAGVSTIPGSDGALAGADQAVRAAAEIGYPVMLKASAGGGGKGMRVAYDADECREGFTRASNEAESSFGDRRVFVEKFIEQPRHIEIQVLADAHGNVISLGERECSIQRRHQKVIEEAPSPFLSADARAAMAEQACALARSVDYRSAGTVEFVVDAEQNFFFLEMNTRLQVEHPVTELVTGLDLVELMLRVAAGEPLPLTQEQVRRDGWAIEARIYAEDPERGFLPAIGRLDGYREPASDRHLRVDSGVDEGADISLHYDPMIAKLIVWDETRDLAVARLRAALDRFELRGVRNNLGFLSALARLAPFQSGDFSTHFIAETYPDGFRPPPPDDDAKRLFAAAAALLQTRLDARLASAAADTAAPRRDWVVLIDGDATPLRLNVDGDDAHVVIDDHELSLHSDWRPGDSRFEVQADGRALCIQVETRDVGFTLRHDGLRAQALALSPRAAELVRLMPVKQAADLSKYLLSPMPGLLTELLVAAGDEVEAGQGLCVVEAMKMENLLRAERAGRVVELLAEVGDSLIVDQPIVEFE